MGNIWSLKSDLIRHRVSDISTRLFLVVSWFDQCIKKKVCLNKLLFWFCVHHVIEKVFIQTHCISCFTKIHYVFLHNFSSEKSRHHVLDHSLCWFWVLLVIEKWFKETHCVRYFTKNYLVCFTIIPVEQADTTCYLINCNDLDTFSY